MIAFLTIESFGSILFSLNSNCESLLTTYFKILTRYSSSVCLRLFYETSPMGKKCCVPNCTDKTSKKHRFPNPNRKELKLVLQTWMEKIKNPQFKSITNEQIYNNYRICEKHFTPDCLVPSTKRGLMVDAIPTLHLGNEKYSESDCFLDLSSSCSLKVEGTSPVPEDKNFSITSQNTRSAQSNNLHLSEQVEDKWVVQDYPIQDHTSYEDEEVAVKTEKPDIEWINPDTRILETLGIQNLINKECVPDDTKSNISIASSSFSEKNLNNKMAALPNNLGILLSSKKNVCRFCLGTDKVSQPLFNEASASGDEIYDYRESILSSVPIKVEKNDGLPQYMCENCNNSLLLWHNFREMCVSTNIILRQYVSNMSLTKNTKTNVQQHNQSISSPNLSTVNNKELTDMERVGGKVSTEKRCTPDMSGQNAKTVIHVSDQEHSSMEYRNKTPVIPSNKTNTQQHNQNSSSPNMSKVMNKKLVSGKLSTEKHCIPNASSHIRTVTCFPDSSMGSVKKKPNILSRKRPIANQQPKRTFPNLKDVLNSSTSTVSSDARNKQRFSKKVKIIPVTSDDEDHNDVNIESSKKQLNYSVEDNPIILMNNMQYAVIPVALEPDGLIHQSIIKVETDDNYSENGT